MSVVSQRFALRVLALSMLLLAGCGVSDQPTTQIVPSPATQPARTSTPPGPEHDATKAALGVQMENEMATYAVLPSPTLGILPTPTPPPTVQPSQEGLGFDCSPSFQGFKFSNCWYGMQNNQSVAVFAGTIWEDESHGVILIKIVKADEAVASEFTLYFTPEKRGRIMLEQVKYPRFFLRADEGTLFIFNAGTHQWEAAPVVPLPTDVPPTFTPLPAVTSMPTGTLSRTLLIGARGPIAFTFIDSQGQRLGYDPAGSDTLKEIPNGQYGIDAEGMPFGSIYDPIAGDGTITIVGTDTGTYRISGVYYDSTGVAGLFVFDGQTTAGAHSTERVYIPGQAIDYPQPPDAHIAMNDTAVVGQPVPFAGTFTDGNPNDTHTIVWDFGDGAMANSTLTPTHTYVQPGIYTVTLTVRDSAGFKDQESIQITVEQPL